MGATVKSVRAFAELQRRTSELARGAFAGELTRLVGAALVKEVADEFRQSRDPYGRPWAPVMRQRARDRRARRRREAAGKPAKHDKPLIDTGRLRASVVARTSTSGEVRIALPVEYASFHDNPGPSSHQTMRQILPRDATGGLGPFWTRAISKTTRTVLRRYLFGRGPGGG